MDVCSIFCVIRTRYIQSTSFPIVRDAHSTDRDTARFSADTNSSGSGLCTFMASRVNSGEGGVAYPVIHWPSFRLPHHSPTSAAVVLTNTSTASSNTLLTCTQDPVSHYRGDRASKAYWTLVVRFMCYAVWYMGWGLLSTFSIPLKSVT